MKALLESLKPGDTDLELAQSLDPDRLPRHVAIIMDGNGRWAKKRNLPRIAGHKAGVGSVRTTVEVCAQLGIEALTLYAFSAENWKRPRTEVDMLWRLLRFYLRKELSDLDRNGIRLQALGRIDALPERVRDELAYVQEATSGNGGLRLNLAINYSGRAEIVDAVNAAIDRVRLEGNLGSLRIDEETISANLYSPALPDPDLLIRTSGEMRISNYLLWQIAYTEIFVTDRLWPDFRGIHLLEAIADFQRRERRFGGLSDNVLATDEEAEQYKIAVS